MPVPLRILWVTVLVLCLASTSDVLAANAGDHGGGGDPVHVDPWQAGFTITVFIVLLLILGKWVWRPVLKGLQAREAFITKSIEDANEANKKAQQQLADYTAQLDRARAEASAIVDEGRRDAEVVKKALQEEARKEADAMIARAKREIAIARDTAVRDLYRLGANLATEAAGKIIAKELNPADHQRLIEESIAELKNVDVQSN
jgi:F-type H+-transporting ATPase subunit b